MYFVAMYTYIRRANFALGIRCLLMTGLNRFAKWTTPKRNINHAYHSPQADMHYTDTTRGGMGNTPTSSAGTRLPTGIHDQYTTSSPQSTRVPQDHISPHRRHSSLSGRDTQKYRAVTGRRIRRNNTNSRYLESIGSERPEFGGRSDRSRSKSVSSGDRGPNYHTYFGSGGDKKTKQRGSMAGLSFINEDDESLEARF